MTTARKWTLVATILGSGVVFLDSTIVTVALPRIGQELPSQLFGTLEAQSYVYNGYLLTLSALLILAGALTDALGRRRMFAVGLAGFGITSLLCALAPTMELLIVARLLQGAAGALLVPASLSIITATFTGEERGRAFGIWAGASAATTILGPFVGGALVDTLSWRAAFLLNVPIVIVGLWATLRHVAESRDEEAPAFDWLGSAVIVLALGGLTFGAIRGQEREWQDGTAFVALAVGAVATAVFPVLMARSRHPLVPLGMFRSRNFAITNLSTLLIYGGLYVTVYFLSLFLQGTLGYNATAAGVATIPGLLFLALFSPRFGSLAARYGPRWFMAVGPTIMAAGVLLLARVPSSSNAWVLLAGQPRTWVPPIDYVVDVLPGVLGFGIGAMVMVAPLTTALMTSVPVEHSGLASAINNAISRIGPQLAGALIFIAVTATFYSGLAERVSDLDVSSPQVRDQLAPLNVPAPDASPAAAAAARTASTEAFGLAMQVAGLLFLLGAGVNAAGIQNAAVRTEPAPEAGAAPAV